MHDSGLDQYGSCGNDEEGWGFEQNLKIEPVGFPDALYVECELRMTTRFLAQGGRRRCRQKRCVQEVIMSSI